ncbi:MAG TPA: hypothetical protein VFY29_04390 [Terriglobia bacterium]|nr:hypothetical protein [Terriglobia bacterium]
MRATRLLQGRSMTAHPVPAKFKVVSGHRPPLHQSGTSDTLFAFALALLLLFILYPGFFMMTRFAMGNGNWELYDPAVSSMTFVPGMRVVRYELWNHGNLLWSNLRGLGQPLLGNEVQSAPLYPLTWLWIWAPEPYYWNLLLLSRLTLLGVASFLIGRRLFGFSRWGAFLFMFCLAFSIHVLRWMNHPWQNGILAGLWAMLAMDRVMSTSRERRRFVNMLLTLSAAYCLATSGFPEGALAGAVLAALALLPRLIAALASREIDPRAFIVDVATGGFAGLALASPQILDLIELMGNDAYSFRTSAGLAQYGSPAFLLDMVARFSNDSPWGLSIHFFNLIPLFFFALGLTRLFRQRRMLVWDLAATLCLGLWVLKCFPVWPAFNAFVVSLPVFSGAWFIIYFFILPIFFFAYTAARGGEFLAEAFARSEKGTGRRIVLTAAAVFALLFWSLAQGGNFWPRRVYEATAIFGGFICAIWMLWRTEWFRTGRAICWTAVAALLLLELVHARPRTFIRIDSEAYERDFSHTRPGAVADVLRRNGLAVHEAREGSDSGAFVKAGIATMNNGATALSPSPRLERFLLALFRPFDWRGVHMPMVGQRTDYSWQAISTSIYVTPTAPEKRSPSDTRKFEYLGDAEGLHVYRDINALPRAYLAGACLPARDFDEALAGISDATRYHLGDVFLEGLDPAGASFCAEQRRESPARVAIAQDSGSRLALVPVTGPGVLVLNDSDYPGWKARDRITGKEVPISHANGVFRGLLLTETRPYEIEFEYTPVWRNTALTLILAATLLIAIRGFQALRNP